MQPLTTDQLRQAYIDFFVQKHGHAEIPGASLIPENDPTVLFTTAGMHPLVPYLLGEKHPSGQRLVSCQRCVRTQDIDEVGDGSHCTFFEMLGNWSLGDASSTDGIGRGGYFKEEAIRMSFQFLTEVLEMPVGKLAISCFAGSADAPRDEASAQVWESLGIPRERIGFLPKAKNWWGPASHTGPCGPDTEMFFWTGPSNIPPPGSNPANDENNWLEIWNDVFMEYNKNADGTFTPLKQKNVDTGMGVERVAQVMQGQESVYDTDQMKPISQAIWQTSRLRNEDRSTQLSIRSVRVITDHLRAATFIIADGVKPANVDQGYVLRKLIRRAIRSARNIDFFTPNFSFCSDIVDSVVKQYCTAYPHLTNKAREIKETIRQEEQQFLRTLEAGEKQFQRITSKLTGSVIDGNNVFHLYDTYGFPLEVTRDMANVIGLKVDEKGFQHAFEEHQGKSRAGAAQRFAGGLADHSAETTRLHTATHLLHAALRKVLGPHVRQKGSNITAERLRFDFSHPAKVTPEQLAEVERFVNAAIAADLPVTCHVTTVEQAKAEGAIGVFDEKYGVEVKVYVIGDDAKRTVFSREICGGPHVARTGMIGHFTIQKEEAVSAGVRRIKAKIT